MKRLDQLRHDVHVILDSMWTGKDSFVSRIEAYDFLAELMGLHPEATHVRLFNERQCVKAIRKLRQKIPVYRRKVVHDREKARTDRKSVV